MTDLERLKVTCDFLDEEYREDLAECENDETIRQAITQTYDEHKRAFLIAISTIENRQQQKSDIAREIFEEIEALHNRIYNRYVFDDNDYAEDDVAIECAMNYGTDLSNGIDELKKKYTVQEQDPDSRQTIDNNYTEEQNENI